MKASSAIWWQKWHHVGREEDQHRLALLDRLAIAFVVAVDELQVAPVTTRLPGWQRSARWDSPAPGASFDADLAARQQAERQKRAGSNGSSCCMVRERGVDERAGE